MDNRYLNKDIVKARGIAVKDNSRKSNMANRDKVVIHGTTLKKVGKARAMKERWDSIIDDCYSYISPTKRDNLDKGVSARSYDRVYTGGEHYAASKTAIISGKYFPEDTDWMDFEISSGSGENSKIVKGIRDRFHSAIKNSNLTIEIPSSITDSLVSFGAISINPTNDKDRPLHFEALPIREIIPIQGMDGVIDGVAREWSMSFAWAKVRYPGIKEPLWDWNKDGEQDREFLEVFLPHYGEDGKKYWIQEVFCNRELLYSDRFNTLPIVIFRLNKASGEVFGRGPVMQSLGDMQSANQIQLSLVSHANLSFGGMYVADSNVMKTRAEDIDFSPFSILLVEGGASTIQRLDLAGDLKIGVEVFSDYDSRVKLRILGPEPVPEDKVGNITATEIMTRVSMRNALENPQMLRLNNELIKPLSNRIIEILSDPSLASTKYYLGDIEGLVLKPISPLVKDEKQKEAEIVVQAIDRLVKLSPRVDAPSLMLNLPKAYKAMLEGMGVKSDLIQDEEALIDNEAMIRNRQQDIQAQERVRLQMEQQEKDGN